MLLIEPLGVPNNTAAGAAKPHAGQRRLYLTLGATVFSDCAAPSWRWGWWAARASESRRTASPSTVWYDRAGPASRPGRRGGGFWA